MIAILVKIRGLDTNRYEISEYTIYNIYFLDIKDSKPVIGLPSGRVSVPTLKTDPIRQEPEF